MALAERKIEYRVRETTRFIVTRYEETPNSGGSEVKGEFDNYDVAHEVAYALCRDEHQRLGWPVDDGRINYPQPLHANCQIATIART